MNQVILILGGTKEAAELAEKLVAELPVARIISSLAGRTKEPSPLAGEVRIGGFGGPDGLARFLIQNEVTRFIDATHPFAKTISANAKIAAKKTGLDLEIRTRQPWQKHTGDLWIEVTSLEEARKEIPAGARVLLALGSQYIDIFNTVDHAHFIVRMVDEPSTPLPLPHHTMIIGKPGNLGEETAILKQFSITHILCRNSGGQGAYAKIEAARALKIPVIIVEQSV
ncbi:cobalt-precorrin-6A reductase [Ahrensia marina]|uniref:Cobalt-precorrin-6X reductase n=1 Tax=Ahrensia marina TaxID=1514904 RepID=A0A0N0E8X9_9HYPH|nr:cobalt-precorrin-6A reductase [Ahrensia marina]KPB02782.1 cobalt-precorrin-6X reductase [Ahrensia marina]